MFELGKTRTRRFIVYTQFFRELTRVYYDVGTWFTEEDVKNSLVNHDGFKPSIKVFEE